MSTLRLWRHDRVSALFGLTSDHRCRSSALTTMFAWSRDVPRSSVALLNLDWQPCTNSCLEITRQTDRDKLIGTPTILPVHARAGRGRAEAGHTRWGAARFFISDFRACSFRSGCTFFGRENVFTDGCDFSLATSSYRQSRIVLERCRLRLDFTGFDCVDNCNFDKIRTSGCALIAAD